MTTPAIWLVYTLMFGYLYLGTLDQQVVKAFQLVCSRDHA